MDFTDLDAVIHEVGQGGLRLFKFHGEMATVVIYAEMLLEARVVRMFGAKLLEK